MNFTGLITKTNTTNIGNQALSNEVIRLFVENTSDDLTVLGRPTGLFAYSIAKLKRASDPVQLFEKWTDDLLRHQQKFPASDQGTTPKVQYAKLSSFSDFKVKNDGLMQSIKDIFRKGIHSNLLFAYLYRHRYAVIRHCDRIFYSGAGEVSDNNIFLRQLIELRIAQKMGKDTYAINQSVEVKEEPLQSICGLVYANLKGIVVRGTISKDRCQEMMAGRQNFEIKCHPDTAWRNPDPSAQLIAEMKAKYQVADKAVGINSTDVAADYAKWNKICRYLKEQGYELYFISNDPFRDTEVGERIAEENDLQLIKEFMSYQEYAALIANFAFVISCRLHTNELSLTGGTPVIPIEGRHFKTTEVFDLVNYPIKVKSSKNDGWDEEVLTEVKRLIKGDPAIDTFLRTALNDIRKESSANYPANA